MGREWVMDGDDSVSKLVSRRECRLAAIDRALRSAEMNKIIDGSPVTVVAMAATYYDFIINGNEKTQESDERHDFVVKGDGS